MADPPVRSIPPAGRRAKGQSPAWPCRSSPTGTLNAWADKSCNASDSARRAHVEGVARTENSSSRSGASPGRAGSFMLTNLASRAYGRRIVSGLRPRSPSTATNRCQRSKCGCLRPPRRKRTGQDGKATTATGSRRSARAAVPAGDVAVGCPVDDRCPLGLHCLLDGPGIAMGPGRRAVRGRR